MSAVEPRPPTSWRARELVAKDRSGRVLAPRDPNSIVIEAIVLGLAALICGVWLILARAHQLSFPWVIAGLGLFNAWSVVAKLWRRRRLRLEGEPLAKVFE